MDKERRTILTQILLFVLTFITTTLSGAEWAYSKSIFYTEFTWNDFVNGMQYSVPFLLILTVHEFGHYFTAVYHKIKTTLPYYIPIPPIFLSIGTMGAVIRIKSRVYSNIQHFDIGLAGPLAGFIVAVAVLFYGFKTLPPPEYIYQFHPEYEEYGLNYADYVYSDEYVKERNQPSIIFGSNLLFLFFENFVADPERVPNSNELMHYPVLMAGFIALFFTSLNLLPIGQLDGGHVVYGLFGRKGHTLIATVFFVLLLIYSGLGVVNFQESKDELYWLIPLGVGFYYVCFSGLKLPPKETLMYSLLMVVFLLFMSWAFPEITGYPGWLVFGLIVGRLLGVHHPPTEIEQSLDFKRQVLGWICLLIFIVSFSPAPLKII